MAKRETTDPAGAKAPATGAAEAKAGAQPPQPSDVITGDEGKGTTTPQADAGAQAPQPSGAITGDEAKGTTAPQADAGAQAPQPSGMVVRITGPKKGRWRAGRRFTAEPVDIPLDDLTKDKATAFNDDPTLSVEVIPVAT